MFVLLVKLLGVKDNTMALTLLKAMIPLDTDMNSFQAWINATTVNSILSITLLPNNSILVVYT